MMKPARGTGEAGEVRRTKEGMMACMAGFTEPMTQAGMGGGISDAASACLGHRCLGMSSMMRRWRETNEQVLLQRASGRRGAKQTEVTNFTAVKSTVPCARKKQQPRPGECWLRGGCRSRGSRLARSWRWTVEKDTQKPRRTPVRRLRLLTLSGPDAL